MNKIIYGLSGVIIIISLLNVNVFADTTTDCLAWYTEETGEMNIPCLEYRDKNGVLHKKILFLNLKKISLTNEAYILEVTDVDNSHIQHDDLTPTEASSDR